MLGRLAQPTVRAWLQPASPATALPGCVSTAAPVLPARYTGIHIGTLARSIRVRCVNTSQSVLATSASDKSQVRVAFIGAGGINFGTPEGPWNHSSRLEQIPGVTFTAIVDPNESLAQERIDTLSKGEHKEKWADTKVFSNYQAMLEDAGAKPDAAFIGLPPKYHGALEDKNANIELEMAKAGISLFVEKPLSVRPAAEVAQLAQELKHLQDKNNAVIAVGYMFRYSALAQTAKKILKEHNATPLCVIARYACGYSEIRKKDWWDTSLCGGPIVEQATHFVDLMRYFGGEIVEDTVKAVAVGPEQPLVDMPQAPEAEHEVPMERRINRVTAAVWQFDSGAVGSLTHSLVLHTSHYETELEILADGLHLILTDPYNKPQLKVRYPGSAEYKQVKLDERDMYMIEAEVFINAIKTGNTDAIETLYEDSALSYQASQWITAASKTSRTKGQDTGA